MTQDTPEQAAMREASVNNPLMMAEHLDEIAAAMENGHQKYGPTSSGMVRLAAKAIRGDLPLAAQPQPVDVEGLADIVLDWAESVDVKNNVALDHPDCFLAPGERHRLVNMLTKAALSQQGTVDDFTLLMITNAYEKGICCGNGSTDAGKDLREMYTAGSLEQRAYVMGFEEGKTQRDETQQGTVDVEGLAREICRSMVGARYDDAFPRIEDVCRVMGIIRRACPRRAVRWMRTVIIWQRQALAFYANEANWQWNTKPTANEYVLDCGSEVQRDFGAIARAALTLNAGGTQ